MQHFVFAADFYAIYYDAQEQALCVQVCGGEDAGVVNSGDATTDGVINNIRTRVGELETKLQALGLLT